MRFEDKTIIVTGAGSGIGAATAARVSAEGANVVLVGRTQSKLEDTAADLPKDRTQIVAADVSVDEDIQRVVDTAVSSFGGIDTLVNNAAIAKGGRIDRLAPEDFEKMLSINVSGLYRMTRAAWPHLMARKGNVINVSSVSGLGGDWGMFGYNTAKGAVSNMTRALALDFKKSQVRVNAVAPSLTYTEMTKGIQGNDALQEAFAQRIPIGRGAEPAEIADVIAFLASHDARFVNGVVLPVDGGLTASNGQPAFG